MNGGNRVKKAMDGRWWKQRKERKERRNTAAKALSEALLSIRSYCYGFKFKFHPSNDLLHTAERERERCSCAGKGERYARRGEKEIRQKNNSANTRESPQAGPLRDVEPYTHSVRVDDDDRIKYEKQAEQRKPDFSSLFVYKLKFFFFGRFRSPTTW